MAEMKDVTTPTDSLPRRYAPITSAVLLALPEARRPNLMVACTSCPNASWSLSEKMRLTCLCATRRYMAWTPTIDGLILCDDREAALGAQDDPG